MYIKDRITKFLKELRPTKFTVVDYMQAWEDGAKEALAGLSETFALEDVAVNRDDLETLLSVARCCRDGCAFHPAGHQAITNLQERIQDCPKFRVVKDKYQGLKGLNK